MRRIRDSFGPSDFEAKLNVAERKVPVAEIKERLLTDLESFNSGFENIKGQVAEVIAKTPEDFIIDSNIRTALIKMLKPAQIKGVNRKNLEFLDAKLYQSPELGLKLTATEHGDANSRTIHTENKITILLNDALPAEISNRVFTKRSLGLLISEWPDYYASMKDRLNK